MNGFSDWLIYLVGLLTLIILCVFGLINAARFLLVSFYQNYAVALFMKGGAKQNEPSAYNPIMPKERSN